MRLLLLHQIDERVRSHSDGFDAIEEEPFRVDQDWLLLLLLRFGYLESGLFRLRDDVLKFIGVAWDFYFFGG